MHPSGPIRALASISALFISTWVHAAGLPISPGGSQNGITVLGTTSIYDVFGHAGNPGGDVGLDSPAVLLTFSAAAGNVFRFSASGLISCCSDTPNIAPDGGTNGTNIGAANGLSGISGNSNLPLVGVYTSETDPFGGTAPASLSFDAANPTSLSPALHQVFYIGDGKAGFNSASGGTLSFTAPSNATRLYIGIIDAFAFGGSPGYYADNNGSFTVNVSMAAVPEPSAFWLYAAGAAAVLGARARRRHR